MRQSQLSSDLGGNGWRAITLTGVMAAGQKRHATLAGVMRLRLGYLAGDERVRSGNNGSLEVPLRTTTAPRYIFNSYLRSVDEGNRPI